MTDEKLEAFVLQVPNLGKEQSSAVIEYFVYYLTVIGGDLAATPAAVERCFELTRIQKYSNISAFFRVIPNEQKRLRQDLSKP